MVDLHPQPSGIDPAAEIPRARAIDESLGFLLDGYTFGRRRFRRLGTDVFTTRLAGRRATVMYGAEAARIFYEGDRFSRDRAMPTSVLHLLQDEGSVQTLEGDEHRHRKTLFMQMLEPASVERLVQAFDAEWTRAVAERGGRTVSLYDLAVETLTVAAAAWCGIPGGAVDLSRLSGDLAAMVDRAASFGPPNWIARARRRKAESDLEALVEDVRSGALDVQPGTPLHRIAEATDADGDRLPASVAAVELLNVLRPVVAVSRFLVFAAHALHHHPEWRRPVAADPDVAVRFANEVRRRYPFFPIIAGTVQRAFTWRGRAFRPGEWVILDLYATNHDVRSWSAPARFLPRRFEGWNGDPNTLIPQGGGDLATGHRCPGEAATIALTARFARRIAADDPFSVPKQDLRISLRRIPALPQDRFRVTFRS
ncbi:cytochrome P450 [Agromyces sp. Marseille-P2726]|uniref:cytochrome P450 n=1 Tax=Agromyces sp. Marseille-P2726 TaxID=2709132 RepID=UPI00156E79B8|nr:cytochrome P450 [Agromyces sp. Marseille-P2726]